MFVSLHSKRVVAAVAGWRMRGEGRREKMGVDKRMSESQAKYV